MTAPYDRRSRQSDAESAQRDGLRPMHISLRSGEKLFLNGAVVRVDRKVTLELLNDATFLLENHVLQVADTTTPLRQLYFAAQAMLMDPQNAEPSRALFDAMAVDMASALTSPALREGIAEARAQVASGRPFHALKTLRGLFADEAAILGRGPEPERLRPVANTDPTPFARDRQPCVPANDDTHDANAGGAASLGHGREHPTSESDGQPDGPPARRPALADPAHSNQKEPRT